MSIEIKELKRKDFDETFVSRWREWNSLRHNFPDLEEEYGPEGIYFYVLDDISSSHICWSVSEDLDPFLYFGVRDSDQFGIGEVWLMADDRICNHWLKVARNSRKYIEKMHDYFSFLWVSVEEKLERERRFVEWCGFEEMPMPVYIRSGVTFHEYRRIRS